MLFRDVVCLSVDITDLARAQAVARDFRGCTRTVKVGQALYTAHGPIGARSFHELGMADVILDLRLCGTPTEVGSAVYEASNVLGVAGVTVQAMSGAESLAAAVRAAAESIKASKAVRPPRVLALLLPGHLSDETLQNSLLMRSGRDRYVAHTARLCEAAGVDGLVCEYRDLPVVRKTCRRLPCLAFAKRGVCGYLQSVPKEQRQLPGVSGVLRAGAKHVFFEAALIGSQDPEWTSDMVLKELQSPDTF
jgi:orotidine-5'-phosphate decarboxylase